MLSFLFYGYGVIIIIVESVILITFPGLYEALIKMDTDIDALGAVAGGYLVSYLSWIFWGLFTSQSLLFSVLAIGMLINPFKSKRLFFIRSAITWGFVYIILTNKFVYHLTLDDPSILFH